MEISKSKIEAKLKELNKGLDSPVWVEIEEQGSLMKTEFKDKEVIFKGDLGFIVKIFFNTNTGELKFFPIHIFKEDEVEK